MSLIMNHTFLFRTTETDDSKVFLGNNGKYYCKRYGLALHEITESWAINLAWMEANRSGRFEHLVITEGYDIPHMTNPDAQSYIVSRMLQNVK